MTRTSTFALTAVAGIFVASSAMAGGGGTYGPGAGGAIPDSDPIGFSSTISVPDTFAIGEAYVTINNLSHTWSSDLEMTLTHVDSATSILFVDPAGDSSDYGGTYTFRDGEADLNAALAALGGGDVLPSGSYSDTASAPFSSFNGGSSFGDWTLTIVDTAGGDAGSYESWTLTLVEVPAPGAFALLGVAGLASRRRRRA